MSDKYFLPIYKRNNIVCFTMVDKIIYEIFQNKKLRLNNKGYVIIHTNNQKYLFHRYIYNTVKTKCIDHINGNPLDNRICNLRECTHQENSFNQKLNSKNTTGFKGVKLEKRTGKYEAYIKYNKKVIHLGTYKTIKEAIFARKSKEIELFGEFSAILSRNK